MIMRSAIWAMVSSWVIMTRVCPYLETQFLRIEMTSISVLESRLPVGSSARMIAGLEAIALAIATRYFCPPDSMLGVAVRRSSMPMLFTMPIT